MIVLLLVAFVAILLILHKSVDIYQQNSTIILIAFAFAVLIGIYMSNPNTHNPKLIEKYASIDGYPDYWRWRKYWYIPVHEHYDKWFNGLPAYIKFAKTPAEREYYLSTLPEYYLSTLPEYYRYLLSINGRYHNNFPLGTYDIWAHNLNRDNYKNGLYVKPPYTVSDKCVEITGSPTICSIPTPVPE